MVGFKNYFHDSVQHVERRRERILMKVVYATDISAANIHNWSGLSWYYRKMLEEAGCDVTLIDRSDMPNPFIPKFKQYLSKKFEQKLYSPRFSVAISKSYANYINSKIAPGSVVLSQNTIVLAYLKKEVKKVLYIDATFDSLLHLYPNYNKYTAKCLREGEAIDQQAVANADRLIYTSQWAADSAINHYGADPKKIFIVPFGANLDCLPSFNEISSSITKRIKTRHLNLLFLGVDWVRKGGDKALEIVTKLNELGFPATLHIVGAVNVPEGINLQYIVNHGFISKATVEGQQQIGALLLSSHFLILPTLADCTPVACSEANAFGVPCITSDVGGLKSIIKDDVNGRTFPLQNITDGVVHYIISLMESKNAYKELCYASYNRYVTELNWKSTGAKI